MRVSIFGLGYVGAVSSGCLAELGHTVIGVDISTTKVAQVQEGKSPIVEDGIGDLMSKNFESGRLSATTDAHAAISATDIAFLCVGTPSDKNGGVDSQYLERACTEIGRALRDHPSENFVVFNRSTCLPDIHSRLIEILAQESEREIGQGLSYVCHPEFLREGEAVSDFFAPPKIVFGVSDEGAVSICKELYPNISAGTFFTSVPVASMIKYSDNCFHAVKVTFGNEMGALCKAYDVDSHEVMSIFCKDHVLNISEKYLRPGFAFGGSCLPKDLRAVSNSSQKNFIPLPLLNSALESNRAQIDAVCEKFSNTRSARIGVIGLAFKERTDDVRESPMVYLAEYLSGKGHQVSIFDGCIKSGSSLVGQNKAFLDSAAGHLSGKIVDRLEEVIAGADYLIVAHRLSPEQWRSVDISSETKVIDLVNVSELKRLSGYDGLYW